MGPLELKDYVARQLIHLEESKKAMLDAYFPLPNRHQERKLTEILFERYTHRLEKLLVHLAQEPDTRLTFVIIGSTVTARHLSSNETEIFTICYPDSTDVDEGHISFLSPLGRQLLLAPIYTPVNVSTPGGEYELKIEDIKVL